MIGARVIALGIGYLFGLFQTGYLYGKSQGIDIRNEGSGNAGTTNSLRVLGIKAGLITFAGDLCKAILAVLLVKVLFRNAYPDAFWNCMPASELCSDIIFRFTSSSRVERESPARRA